MTDEELKALVASLAKSQQKTDEQLKQTNIELKELFKETDARFKETDAQIKQTNAQLKETDAQIKQTNAQFKADIREVKALWKETDARFKETDAQIKQTNAQFKADIREVKALWKETDARFKETDARFKETDAQLKENSRELKELGKQTDHQLKELGKHIGGLGNKFGGFTEGLAFPAMSKILQERFGMEFIATRVKKRRNGKVIEVDMVAYSNSASSTVILVEVKSHLMRQSIPQFLKTLKQFPLFFPEHRDKALYGILAFVDYREDFLTQAEEAGLYLASIHDDLFEIKSRPHFQPKNFQ